MSVIEVAIGYARDPGKFRVQVVDSPVGHASADVDLDVEALLEGRAGFERALLLSSVPMRRKLSDEEKLIQDAGRSLFTALLGTGEVAGRYRSSVDRAADHDEQLRIVLRIDAPELAALPWEAMYDEATGGYVCRQHQLVRHVPLAAAAPPLTVKPPLRILGVISAPHGMHAMNAQAEREQLLRALAEPVKNGLVEVTWAPSATWADLHDQLLAGPWHVIHFVGHGEFDPDKDEGLLYLTREDGSADPVSASRFADLLRQARPMPRLIVLNSCRSASSSTGDLFSGTAAALARSGVAAVAAMQYSISDNAAVAFARGFYTALARGRGVDDAVSSGRVGILGTSDETLEWLTPALYLRGHETHLFTPDRVVVAAMHPTTATRVSAQVKSRSVQILEGMVGLLRKVAFSPDGSQLVTTGTDGTTLWDTATFAPMISFASSSSLAPGFTFSPDTVLFAVIEDGYLSVGDTSTCDLSPHFGIGSHYADFSPDGTLLASATNRGVEIWNPYTRLLLHEMQVDGGVRYVTFSPDGALLAMASDIGSVELWETEGERRFRWIVHESGTVPRVAFNRDGLALARSADAATAYLTNAETGVELRVLPGKRGAVNQLAFSPDDVMVVTVGQDMSVRLWDYDMESLALLLDHRIATGSEVAFSPGGSMVAMAARDNAIRIWEIGTGWCVDTFTGHEGAVRWVAFSPDGRRLASAGSDGTARIWEL